jgi:two-component system sensor kinase FixL
MWSTELQALMDTAVDAVILVDDSGRIGEINISAQRLFGYSKEELLGTEATMLFADAHRDSNDSRAAASSTNGSFAAARAGREIEARRKDGSVFPAYLSLGQVPGAQPPRFVGFVRDITPQRETEAAIARERDNERRIQERLLHVSRMATMGEMAAGIAHELNQPLAAITNYAHASDHLLGAQQPDVLEIRTAVREISAQALRAGEIIRKLRHLVGHQEPQRSITQINEMIEELALLTQADARRNGTRVRIELGSKLPKVNIDRIQIQQVLLNLWRNALEALASGARDSREVTVKTRGRPDGDIEIYVCDNGDGIEPSMVERVFDPFFTTKPERTGLGLAISRTIVNAHGGSIVYRPNQPKGACFLVSLPSLRSTSS